MSILGIIKQVVEATTGIHLFRKLPQGVNVFEDIAFLLPDYNLLTIFDVGANIGQSAGLYLALFPMAVVYCFEPAKQSFNKLVQNVKNFKNARCMQIAIGAQDRDGVLITSGTSTMNRLVDYGVNPTGAGELETELVQVARLDDFCAKSNISHIDYLKIDTEGADLDVIKGAEDMISGQRIDLIEVEAGMNSRNRRHAPFESIKAFMESHDYDLFGVYAQCAEWPTDEINLRRANCVFISRKMIESHRHKIEPAA